MISGARFTEKMKSMAEEKNYGRTIEHIQGVLRYSKEIYDGLAELGLIEANRRDIELLMAAGYLHDVGDNVADGELGVRILPEDDHNLKSFKWFQIRFNQPDCDGFFVDSEKAIVNYCILWHKGNAWELKPELPIDWISLLRARLLASILRVGDPLSSAFCKHDPVIIPRAVSVVLSGKILSIEVSPRTAGDLKEKDLAKANERGKDLLEAVMKAMAFKKVDSVQIELVEP